MVTKDNYVNTKILSYPHKLPPDVHTHASHIYLSQKPSLVSFFLCGILILKNILCSTVQTYIVCSCPSLYAIVFIKSVTMSRTTFVFEFFLYIFSCEVIHLIQNSLVLSMDFGKNTRQKTEAYENKYCPLFLVGLPVCLSVSLYCFLFLFC